MTVKKGVFLAANNHASLAINGVYVHASDANTPNAYLEPTQTDGRPFVLAVADSKMNIDHSTFRYLGRDWNTSYGVSWSKGATGSITNSTLEHNFIGVYTNGSPSLKVHWQHAQLQLAVRGRPALGFVAHGHREQHRRLQRPARHHLLRPRDCRHRSEQHDRVQRA